jgi:protein-S-isoprenylcysteine O-methyltransferase Ste14
MFVRLIDREERDMTNGPGVRVPPPAIFVIAGLLAWGLHTRLAFTIDGSGAGIVQRLLGAVAVAAGIACIVWAGVTLTRSHTTINPNHAASHLVTTGPYARTRNPIYLGLTAMFLGVALIVNSGWMVVLLPVTMIVVAGAVIAREERHLQSRFGGDFDSYAGRVRRWL